MVLELPQDLDGVGVALDQEQPEAEHKVVRDSDLLSKRLKKKHLVSVVLIMSTGIEVIFESSIQNRFLLSEHILTKK